MTNNHDTDFRANLMASADRAASYGANETNPLWMSEATHENIDYSEGDVPLSDLRITRIVRLRLLTDPGSPFYDISYCYGQLKDGRYIRVNLGDHMLPKRGTKGRLIELAKEAGRYGKGLGLLDEGNWSILR